jgi:two-component system cell cycle response regulator DivK
VEAAGKFLPDLILLDIQLPTVDGYSTARQLRQNESLRAVPIVAVTSYAMPGDREKAIEAGCNGYIEKPIDPATFTDEIARYLRKADEKDEP